MQVSKRLIVLGIFGLLALPLMGVASAQNLLTNGDFETNDLTGWLVFQDQPPITEVTVVSGQQTDGNSAPGDYSAFMDNNTGPLGLTLKQSTAAASVAPGPVYYRFDLKLGEQALGGIFQVEIFAEGAGGGNVLQVWNLGNFSPADWAVIDGVVTAPAGTDFMTIQFLAITGADAGTISKMYVDNAYLAQVEPPVATEEMSMGSIKALFR